MWSTNSLLESLSHEEFNKQSSSFLFKNLLSSEGSRPKDNEKTAALALYLTINEDLELKFKAASYVVFMYKCLESSQSAIARDNFYFFDDFEGFIERKIDFNLPFKGIRDDFRQIYLSLLTVRWHVEILLGLSPISTLTKVDAFAKKVAGGFNNITFTQNIGRALLLYSYILFTQKDEKASRRIILNLWSYFCDSCTNLVSSEMPSSSHLGDFSKLSVYVQHSKAGIEWMDEVRKRKQYWDEEVIAKLVSRVRVNTHPQYLKVLLNYLKG